MKLHTLYRTQILPVAREVAWAFFSDPGNLARITPSWLDFQVTSMPYASMYAGQILTYTVAPLPGCKVRWVTEITQADEPQFFIDEQRLGPYRFWHHQHFFLPAGQGVRMDDLVHYALPFWPLGELAHAAVRKRLEDIFDFRRNALNDLFV